MSRNHADATWYVVKGPADGAADWVGREVVVDAPYPVNEAQIAYFAALVEDPNENYWDAAAAKRRYGAIISPGAMMQTWIFPTPWHPGGPPKHGPVLALEVPLPGETLINVSTETLFHAPIRAGDRLTYTDRIEAISPLKRTAVGEGYFVTTRTVCRNQDGADLATNNNVIYRYDTAPASERTGAPRAGRPALKPAAAPDVERLPEVTMPITITSLVLNAAATRDFFPGHHDGDYARAQGVRDAYHNTMFFQGLVDRVGYAWAGYDAWLVRRELRMVVPACNGDTMRTDGRVVERREQDGRRMAEVEIDVLTENGVAVTTRLTFDLDGWSGAGS
jgi:acyl dehydratase